ncbi:MAG TPA: thioredoxin, partial [Luteimonas sp.]|nr:thioredoxin [Luteimonas sp.]
MPDAPSVVFDASTETFESEVLQRSLQVPVLVDFWAEWCGPCKSFGPILETLAADYNGAFVLAKVDVDKDPQIAGAFQVRSIPTVFLVRDGQIVDGFPGALPEAQVREFLAQHGVVPGEAVAAAIDEGAPAVVDPHADVARLRAATAAEPDKDDLKLDLALALLQTGAADEAGTLLEGLPANLYTDDRAIQARARLAFATALTDAPAVDVLEAAIARDPGDLRARHLLGVRRIVAGQSEAGLEQFIEMLQRDRGFDDGLPKKALIDAFRVVDDADLVSRYRRR